jgi:hypothetical protein
MTRRPTRRQRTPRTRPRRGPGPGKRFPTCAAPAGPLVVSHPSSSNGHAWIPAEQNCHRRPHPNPSAHLASPLPLLRHSRARRQTSDPARGEETGPRRRLEPLAGVHAHRWVDAPPSSGLTAASLCAHVHRRGGERRLHRGFHAMRSSTSGASARS